MRAHLYLLLLAAGICARPQISNIAELLTLLEDINTSITGDLLVNLIYTFLIFSLMIETPASINNMSCINALFAGTERLKKNPGMKRFRAFFLKFENLKQSLIARPAEEGECETESRNVKKFIEKLKTFIQK
ncbi:IL5 protein, partial [Penelope pileata]|nr:IL5 protein [Penelope pileata]